MTSTRKIILLAAVTLLFIEIILFAGYKAGFLFPGASAAGQVLPESGSNNGDPSLENSSGNGDAAASVQEPVIDPDSLNAGVTVGKRYNEKLVEEGSRNILILGEDKENFLYDTIGIASIDRKGNVLKLIMIPRDTYVEYNTVILDSLKESSKINAAGIFKINYSHHIGAMIKYKGKFNSAAISFLAEVIKEKFGVDVDDYVKVNVEGFTEMVDHFGGVEMYVPYDMDYDDPIQGLSIHLKKGTQHLNGKKAEGFVRFRQGYKADGTLLEIGDPGRKKNQLNFLKAFINQHGSVVNIGKVPGMLGILGKNVQHSIGLGDMLQTYMGLARDIVLSKYTIESENLIGIEKRINGSYYIIFE